MNCSKNTHSPFCKEGTNSVINMTHLYDFQRTVLSYLISQFEILAVEGNKWHAFLCIYQIYILLMYKFPMGKSLSSLQFFWISPQLCNR